MSNLGISSPSDDAVIRSFQRDVPSESRSAEPAQEQPVDSLQPEADKGTIFSARV